MSKSFTDIKTISDLHRFYGMPGPQHPLITIIDLSEVKRTRTSEEHYYRTDFYTISCKQYDGVLKYGRSHFDFDQGSLIFAAPHQVIGSSPGSVIKEGWGLFFHPDLLNTSGLGRKIADYSFFNYDLTEALHISEEESKILQDCLSKIKKEYSQNIDKHTQGLILDNITLLLNYCDRFYDRQFLTRAKVNNDLLQRFENLLKEYFSAENLPENGLPDVKYFASHLNLSPNYLSDLLYRYTGKTTQEYIHLYVVDKAKSLLQGSELTISEIAYKLGFTYPSHFTKVFTSKTGKSPTKFRHPD